MSTKGIDKPTIVKKSYTFEVLFTRKKTMKMKIMRIVWGVKIMCNTICVKGHKVPDELVDLDYTILKTGEEQIKQDDYTYYVRAYGFACSIKDWKDTYSDKFKQYIDLEEGLKYVSSRVKTYQTKSKEYTPILLPTIDQGVLLKQGSVMPGYVTEYTNTFGPVAGGKKIEKPSNPLPPQPGQKKDDPLLQYSRVTSVDSNKRIQTFSV